MQGVESSLIRFIGQLLCQGCQEEAIERFAESNRLLEDGGSQSRVRGGGQELPGLGFAHEARVLAPGHQVCIAG